jgi:hypothetical protein
VESCAHELRGKEDAKGGLKRLDLQEVLVRCLRGGVLEAAEAFASQELDVRLPELRVVCSVQAGRGWSNNGGLLATLAAAADVDTDWLILIVPEHYKRSAHRIYIVAQLNDLAASKGIGLELDGVLVVAY